MTHDLDINIIDWNWIERTKCNQSKIQSCHQKKFLVPFWNKHCRIRHCPCFSVTLFLGESCCMIWASLRKYWFHLENKYFQIRDFWPLRNVFVNVYQAQIILWNTSYYSSFDLSHIEIISYHNIFILIIEIDHTLLL